MLRGDQNVILRIFNVIPTEMEGSRSLDSARDDILRRLTYFLFFANI